MDQSIKVHFAGIAIILVSIAAVGVPYGMYCYTSKYKFYSDSTKSLFTRKDYDNALNEASEKFERGLYYDAREIIKSVSDKIMKRDFASEALTTFGDLFYNTKYAPDDKIKYNDALFYYLLAGSLNRSDKKEIWRYYQIANCHKNIGYDLSAITEYKELIKNYPESVYVEEARLELACLLYNREKIQEAKDVLQYLITNTRSQTILSSALYEMAGLYMKEASILPDIKKTTNEKQK